VNLRRVPFDHPDAQAIDAAVQAFYAEVYGGGDATVLDPAQFDPPAGEFLVGYAEGRPVAAGGWRAVDGGYDLNLRAGDAEIKRMYVAPGERGKGLSRTVLAELERRAAAAGRLRMVLETGDAQPAAIALYRSSGYVPVPVFGAHRDDPRSLCFAKPLTAAEREPRSDQ
jgi:GNAT superfamily N-acetyltransferase